MAHAACFCKVACTDGGDNSFLFCPLKLDGDSPMDLQDRTNHKQRGALFRLSRFSQAYRLRLLTGVKDLDAYCKLETGDSLERVCKDVDRADKILGEYILVKHADRKKNPLALVKHALLGAQHIFPAVKGKIPTAWAHVRTWEEERVSKLRPPLPLPIWLCVVGLARAHASTARNLKLREAWTIFSVLIEVGFFCLLRPGEIFRLRHSDIAMPNNFVLCEKHAAIRIISPKNRRQFGDSQFVLLRNRNAIAWLEKIHKAADEGLLWTKGPKVFADWFRQLMQELKVGDCKFTPASLRPGGATMYYSAGVSIGTLRFMGRWTVEKSLEHYIQLAMSSQIMNRLKPEAVTRLKKLALLCLQLVWTTDPITGIADLSGVKKSDSTVLLQWCRAYARLDNQCRA